LLTLGKQVITADSMGTEPNTRDRIVTEAMRLFAARGFRGTTVGEIEEAAGLAPRAGGLYKHFRSKEEVLEAGIERHVAEMELIEPALEVLPLGEARAELTLIGRFALSELANEMPLMKVVQKDGDRFPELAAKVNARIIERGHGQAVTVVERLAGGALGERAVAALASVALGSLVGYRIEEAMFGPRPVPEDEFLEAWVDLLMTYAEGKGVLQPAATTEVR
jgi:AcrR family transcriptional regulator